MGNAISEIRNPYRSEIMVARKKQTQSSPAVAPLKPQGVGKKRTPQSAYDPAAGCELYEPEKIVAQRMAKGGITQYQVKWVGYEQ